MFKKILLIISIIILANLIWLIPVSAETLQSQTYPYCKIISITRYNYININYNASISGICKNGYWWSFSTNRAYSLLYNVDQYVYMRGILRNKQITNAYIIGPGLKW